MHLNLYVTSQEILQALSILKAQGASQLLEQLDKTSPELHAFIQSNLSLLETELLEAGLPAGETKLILHDIASFAITCVFSVSSSHR